MDAELQTRPSCALDASLEPPREPYDSARRLFAEALGTALLLAVVVGSGIMGERLAAGNAAVALLGNTLATGAALVVLISIFGPISGAHFNPVVTAMFATRRELSWRLALGYVAAQVAGAVLGVWTAHLMFAEPMLQVSTKARDGLPQGFAEAVGRLG
jgi:glycerol uptake facilitator-like aquaporin